MSNATTISVNQEVLKEIRAFNRNVDWLKQQSLKTQPKGKWGSYEEACKILPRSKQWYKMARLGKIIGEEYVIAPKLEQGKDWRMSGNQVEYRLEAIEQLKSTL